MEIHVSTAEQSHYTVLRYLSQTFQPKSYLEIGVREGDSLRIVLDNAPIERLVLADYWTATYGGTGRGGHEHIAGMLADRGYAGDVWFLDGDSKVNIPLIQGKTKCDLILVDGDHSEAGARADLENVLPLLADGGYLVFDDIAHPAHPWLCNVAWEFSERHGLKVAFMDASVPFGVVVWRRD